ncbi:hypothetical protein ACFYOA_15325 [Streptomyces iakyrus]|uniref:hypothetical protein n=1 Tax=Streptomyces iakyrus TaxID=68219 RepID=UPI003674771F
MSEISACGIVVPTDWVPLPLGPSFYEAAFFPDGYDAALAILACRDFQRRRLRPSVLA